MKNKNKLIGGTIWTSLSFLIATIIYLLRLTVLTRFLDKADFGLVAIVLFLVGFTNIFADLGISTSILSQKRISKLEYSSLYWGGLFLSITLYLLLSFTGFVFADFYEEEMLIYYIPVLGLDLVISSIGRQFSVFKQKEFKFKELAIIKIVSELVSFVVALLLVYMGFGIWSLILSLLTASLVNSLLNMLLGIKSHPIVFYFNVSRTKHLYRIGGYQIGAQVLDYISSQIDILLLGKILPMSEMGVYSLIKTLVIRVYSSVNQIITKVFVPYFSKLDSKTPIFKAKYLNVTFIVALLNIFIYTIIILSSREILTLFYGVKYQEYHYLLEILSVWGVFSSIINVMSVVIVVSTGRTDLGFRWTQFRLFLNPIFIFVGWHYFGMVGIAMSQAFYSFFTIFIYRFIVIRHIISTLKNIELLSTFIRPLIVSFFIVFISLYFLELEIIHNLYFSVFIKGFVIFILLAMFFTKPLLKAIRNLEV